MAPRNSNFNNDANQDLVFDNLGLSQEDLGMGGDGNGTFTDPGDDDGDDAPLGRDLAFEGDPGDDDGDDLDADPFALRDDELPQDRRVSHTEGDRRQQQPLRREPRPLPKDAKVRPDKNGNLLNEKGEIVARAGREARYYTSREKAKKDLASRGNQLRDTAGRLDRITQYARQAQTRLAAYESQFKAVKDMGFTPDDQVAAMNLFTQMRKDPKGTLTKLLTRAAANGITIDGSSSGNNQQTQIADVVKNLLDEQLKPFKENLTANQQREQQAQRDRDDQAAVDAEVGQFFSRNPEAVPYAPVFARVLRDRNFAGMSLGEIYARILQNQSRGGGRRSQLRDPGRNGRTPRRGSPPSGRSAPFNGGTEIANVNESYDSIINGILDENRV